MRRFILTLLALILVLGLFAAVGFAGYRFGYARGVQATASGETLRPQIGPFGGFGPNRMPMHNFGFERGFQRGWDRGFPMLGIGFFPLWGLLWRILVLGLIVWFVYWLFTRSGWQLTRTTQTATAATPPAPPAETESKE